MTSSLCRIVGALILAQMAALPARAVPLGDLPGEDISSSSEPQTQNDLKPLAPTAAHQSTTWLTPGVDEQLSRDRTLIPIGKGAVFVPSFTEPRREPEVSVFNSMGRQVKSGQTGERIALDSGTYTLRFGSGTSAQQYGITVNIEEGHTTTIAPNWGGILVETLLPTGEYIEGQYEVIRMDKWINYGKGHGLKEERLQDLKSWVVPAGLYRISKPGEGFNSLRNYITVQINPGELTQLELIFDKAGGDIVAGGTKTLNTRVKVGSNWSFGARIGGNMNLNRTTVESGVRTEALQVSSDIRLKGIYDNVLYLGTNELLLKDNFSKERGRPFSVTSDLATARTNWVRRFNPWLGPYVRGSGESHLFPLKASRDTIRIINPANIQGNAPDTSRFTNARDFEVAPSLDPLKLAEGMGVNIEFISRYYLEANTQVGLAGRQNLVFNSYVAENDSLFSQGKSKYEIGIENTLNATLRIGSQATLDLRTEIFAPNGNFGRVHLDDLTADFRFFLSRNLEIGYIYHVTESPDAVKNRYPSSHSLSLRLSFNY